MKRPDATETHDAVNALAALAQPTRLDAFRLLVRCAPDGCYAGEIAATLGVPPATLSFHLKHLEQAGLVTSRRESRHIVYVADIAGARDLVRFLTQDCCGGRPEICGGLETDAGQSSAAQSSAHQSSAHRSLATRSHAKQSTAPEPAPTPHPRS